jgi:hypothetical protein
MEAQLPSREAREKMRLEHCPYCGFAELPDAARRCPRCQTEISEDGSRDTEPAGTRLSAIGGIWQSTSGKYSPTFKEPNAKKRTQPNKTVFRPIRRPPMAVVRIVDDGEEDIGEEFRVRTDHFVIGRAEGDVVIPHDDAISSRHLELTRELDNGQYRWYVNDLRSTNGTFARVDEAVLQHNQELIFGSHHYRFDAAPQGAGRAAALGSAARKATIPLEASPNPSPEDLQPALIELTPHGDGVRRALPTHDVMIGSEPTQCALVLADDALISPCEARLRKDKVGHWVLTTLNSVSGVWARVHRIEVVSSGQFQIGEQRITVRIP